MAIPSSTWTEIATTTIANYRDTLADNVLLNSPLLSRLRERGNTDTAAGGEKLLENLLYAENSTFGWFAGYELLNISASDVMTSAAFDWKQANCNVAMSGLEKLKNASKEAKFNLLKSRIRVAEITMKNNISKALFYSNTENGGKSIGGLQHLVADLPTSGTVGGIDRSAQLWWANQYYDFSTLSVTASSTTIQHAMNLMDLRTQRGSDRIDFWVAGETYFSYYLESLQTNQRFTQANEGRAGFSSVKYKDADVFYDPNCSSTRMYGLNTNYIHYRPHVDCNFVTDESKAPVNQNADIIPLYWAGNMTVSNSSLQAVICA